MKNQFKKMREALEVVEINNKKYHDNCLSFATFWVKNQFKSFTSEDLKEAYYAEGNDPPNECRVFGSVFYCLSKEGLIFKHDFVYSKNPICHSRPMRSWISIEFKDKQSKNAIKNKSQIVLKL